MPPNPTTTQLATLTQTVVVASLFSIPVCSYACNLSNGGERGQRSERFARPPAPLFGPVDAKSPNRFFCALVITDEMSAAAAANNSRTKKMSPRMKLSMSPPFLLPPCGNRELLPIFLFLLQSLTAAV